MAKAKNTKATKATPKAKPAGPTKAEVLAARDAKIVAAYKSGTDVPDLAPKFGLSGVRIYRILGAKNVTLRPRPKADPKPATKGKATKKAAKKAAPRKATKATKAKPAGKSASAAPALALPKSQSVRRPNKPTPSDS
jgi:hypothetical protein